jgi:hypothetical protein
MGAIKRLLDPLGSVIHATPQSTDSKWVRQIRSSGTSGNILNSLGTHSAVAKCKAGRTSASCLKFESDVAFFLLPLLWEKVARSAG